MSGHSKWAQIKHKKAASDAKRGQLFSKLIREITVSGRQGGARPESNSRLRTALERAREAGMPKETTERAIARAAGEEDGKNLLEILIEATAPQGVMIVIQGITDNTNRSVSEIKRILSDHGARLAEPGSVLWNFERVGGIEIRGEDNPSKSHDDIASLILESGARDFQSGEDVFFVETDFEKTEDVRRSLERNGVTAKGASAEYKPRVLLPDSASLRETAAPLLDVLIGHDDVQEVYTNIANS